VIGIVVVSHSRALATAAVGLASEMVPETDRPVIAVAAGLDETTFGTDATAVAEAIGTADSPDGVLVLLDLGSAVLSTELALEFVDPDVAERVVVSSAPLVEGLVAAVVLASTGAPIDAVAGEAARGLAAKQDHLGDGSAAAETPAVAAEADAQAVEVLVDNPHGLHARPAAKLVALVRSYDAVVSLTDLDTGRGPVDAGSLSMVATLNAQQGHRLRVNATGPQAEDALDAVRQLAARSFDDQPATTTSPPPEARTTPDGTATAGTAEGSGAGPVGGTSGSGLDLAIGPAVVPAALIELSDYHPGDAATELKRSEDARATAADQLELLRAGTAERIGAAEAAIFDAHLALLDDRAVLTSVERLITTGDSAPEAWRHSLDELAATFEGLDDAYQRERAQDVRSVRDRILTVFTGRSGSDDEPPAGGVLVVGELDAATAATLDAGRIAGVAVRAAGTTGHGVIVARSRGIPLITGIGEVEVPAGALVAFDARTATFVVDPDEATQASIRTTLAQRAAERDTALAEADQPAVTLDGHTIPVEANIGSVQDARDARGAEGSGLVRTEVLFGDRREAPGVEEQVSVFRAIAEALDGQPITIRTWDVGGDKPLAFLPHEPEANPFLGERGLRVFRHRPELLRDQLAAVREVARETPVQVMFPMVTTADEVAWALAELAKLGPRPAGLTVGIMVEVPAAALRIATLADGLDFVSIGTNDLTQYTTAADRGNGAVADLADGLDPAVLQLIDQVVRGVPDGVKVAVCGDLASDPSAAVLLVGLGVHELSAVGPQVPLIKARLRQVSLAEAATTAARALSLTSAAEVRALLAGGPAAAPSR
jgi:multiphosphoryl transfer protein